MKCRIFLSVCTTLVSLGCGKVQINDQGFTGTWSDAGAGSVDPRGGSSSRMEDATDGLINDAGVSDMSTDVDGSGSCASADDCRLQDIPGCAPVCADGVCEQNCESMPPNEPPMCGRQNSCDDICVYLARCASRFCVTDEARDYPSVFSTCRSSLCDASPILCEQSTCELFVAFARDLSQPFRELCTGR